MRTPAIALALALGLGTSACSDFLSGPKLSDNPNRPTVANNANLLVSAETNLAFQSEGHLARTVCIWMQQCSGTNKQYLALGLYVVGDDDYYVDWSDAYARGGLLDLRRIEHSALATFDSAYAGVAYVLEAWLIGQTADVWGDIPYTQAADSTIAAPALDTQEEVYKAIQRKLDTAIVFLGTATPAPSGEDVVYGGNVSKWIALANTLKARFYLHTVEPATNKTAVYDSVAKYAALGISASNGSQDYLTFQSGASLTENNLWSQFNTSWADYLSAGKFLVDLLNALPPAPDPRVALYFAKNADSAFVGAGPGEGLAASPSGLSGTRLDPGFRQPLATYVETQLIQAEAAWNLAGGGAAGNAAAQPFVNNARTAQGLGALVVTGLATIMTEKYIVLFQNLETWNDYKRTCLPVLTPAAGSSAIPARLVYPLSEINANPSIPGSGPQQNWNDPNAC
jgi:hypothetical protein